MTAPARTEIGIAAAKTRNGDGPWYGQPPGARRSMPCEPAAAISPTARSIRPARSIAIVAAPPPDRTPMTISASPEMRRQPADDEQRRRRATLDGERRGAGPRCRDGAVGVGRRAGSAGSAGEVGVGDPGRDERRREIRGVRVLAVRAARLRAWRDQRSGIGSWAGAVRAVALCRSDEGRADGRTWVAAVGVAGGHPGGGVTAGWRSARGRPPRPPRDARSPCRTRRTATSPSRPAGCSSGRPG